jgi:hypothetical protein
MRSVKRLDRLRSWHFVEVQLSGHIKDELSALGAGASLIQTTLQGRGWRARRSIRRLLASLAQTISINMSVRNSFEEGHLHFCMNRKPPTMLLWYDTNRRPRGAFVFLVLLSFGETSGPNAMPRRMIGMSPKKSVLGLVLMICAAKGQFCIDPRSWLKELLGSAMPTLSSSGDRTTGVPMHHHRTRYSSQDSTKDSNIEQRTALPSTHKAGPETLSFHARRGIVLQEGIEFRYQLGELAETKKASIFGP